MNRRKFIQSLFGAVAATAINLRMATALPVIEPFDGTFNVADLTMSLNEYRQNMIRAGAIELAAAIDNMLVAMYRNETT